MRFRIARILTGVSVAALVVSIGGLTATGASPNVTFYLVGDSVPNGSMSTTSPPGVALGNYDNGRDLAPGMVLAKSASGMVETDPTKYQQWEIDANSANLSISKLLIWGALKNFDNTATGVIGVSLLDCGSSCAVLETRIKSVRGANNWSRITVPFSTEHEFAPGHSLGVKLVVLSDSDADMWFAYGTATYDGHVLARDVPKATTTSTPTGPTTTIVAGPLVVTTGPPPTTATTVLGGESTTSTSITTTTLGSGGGAGTPPTTTTPVSGSGRSEATANQSSNPGAEILSPEQPQVISNSVSSEIIAIELPLAETLSPQQGLMVVFATVAETFQGQVLAAVALAIFGSLLILAVHGRQDDDPVETTTKNPGSWWLAP